MLLVICDCNSEFEFGGFVCLLLVVDCGFVVVVVI